MWKAPLFNPIPKTSVAHFREPLGRELSAKLTEGLFCKSLCFLQSHRHFLAKIPPLVATRSRFGSCVINAIHYQNAASLPLHKGGFVETRLRVASKICTTGRLGQNAVRHCRQCLGLCPKIRANNLSYIIVTRTLDQADFLPLPASEFRCKNK